MYPDAGNNIAFAVSYFPITQAIIIYKSPKSVSLPAWIETLKERERALLKNEISAIDDELEHPRPPECPPNRIFYDGLFGTKEIKENE